MNLQGVNALAVSILTIVGIVVLIALKDVSATDGLPLIAAIAGLHIGSTVTTATPVATTPVVPVAPITQVTPPAAVA